MIKEDEFKKRRDIFSKKISNNSIAVFFSSTQKIRSHDTEFSYRQDSNFYYLTGFTEDNSALVFVKEKTRCKIVLFVQEKDKEIELWTGKRLGTKKAKKSFVVDEVYNIKDLEKKLKEFVVDKYKCYFDFNFLDKRVQMLKSLTKDFISYKNVSKIVGKMRLIKSDAEIKLIKKAIDITKQAHHNAIKHSKSKNYEYEIQAQLEYDFKSRGAYSDAYTSIVASGNNANTLHYIKNNKKLKKDDLILIDAGCEYNYYASDITRTIPTCGLFTLAQKELYDAVLKVQKKIIKMIKPKVSRTKLQHKAQEMLCREMIRLGIIKSSYKKAMKKQEHKKYYPHGIGHWMGIDVHDACSYKNDNGDEILLDKGMVLTIEPGIYLDRNDKSIPKKYRGIGIRIEDNILVTKNGYENLSKEIVKEIKDIEKMSREK